MTQSDFDNRDKQIDQDQSTETLQMLEELIGLGIDSISLFRFIGYGLLVLALFDIIDTFVPFRFMNAGWTFQTLGALVERVPVPLLGLILIFYGKHKSRQTWERPVLRGLSWGVLLAGIGYLLFIPWGMVATWHINFNFNNQFREQLSQNLTPIEQFKGQLEAVNTKAQMEALLSRTQGLPPNIKEFQNLEEVKQNLSQFIANSEEKLRKEAEQAHSQRRLNLVKQSVKWNLGALVSGVLLIGIWRATKWVWW